METLRFEFVDGSAELVSRGSSRYRELIEDGHTPVGSVPPPDGISDTLDEYLRDRLSVTAAEATAGLAPRVDEVEAEVEGRLSEAGLSATIGARLDARPIDAWEAGVTDAVSDISSPLNALLAANPGRTVFLRPGPTYTTKADNGSPTTGHGGGIVLDQPDITLDLRGATIAMQASSSTHYQILDVNAAGVRVVGGRLIGDVGSHVGGTGEFGHGISVGGLADRAVIDGTYVTKCWGDGVFIWERPEDVELRSIVADDNRRQGLSIIDAIRPRVLGGAYINTGLTAWTGPAAGIDLEPDAATTRDVIDALIVGVVLDRNRGQGLWSSSNGRTISAQVIGARATRNGLGDLSHGFHVSGANNRTTISASAARGNTGYGFLVDDDTAQAALEGCEADANALQGYVIEGDQAELQACRSRLNGATGFYVDATATGTVLTGCTSLSNAQTDGTAIDFDIYGNGTALAGCVSRAGAETNKPAYGFVVRGGATGTKARGLLAMGTFGSGTWLDMGTGTSVDLAP